MMNDERNEAPSVSVPLAVRIVIVAMAVSAGITAIRFAMTVVTVIERPAPPSPGATVAIVGAVVIVAAVSVSFPLIAIVSIRRGWRVTPVLVVLIGLWGATELVTWADPMAPVSAVVGIAAAVAVWTPAALSYGKQLRSRRLGAHQDKPVEPTVPEA